MFLWRACSEALPTFLNLSKRKIMEETRCPICGLEEETSGHALWNCEATRDIWSQASKSIQKLFLEGSQFKEIWMQMIQKLPQKLLEEAGSIVRLIWTMRNDFVHGKDFRHPNSIVRKVYDDLRCLKGAEQAVQAARTTENSGINQKWKAPPEGMYKMNWDAALNKSRGLLGVGGLIRDSKGQVLGSLRAKRSLIVSPFVAEAYSMMMAILFCKDVGFQTIIFEGDSLQVVERMHKSKEDWSHGSLIIEDTKRILEDFVSWKFSHTKRDSNMAAHDLAKNALLSDQDLYMLEEIPSCIKYVVQLEAF
ncbi:uncharacterized protein LOC122284558 [Carya illinoinensis]|uniref:uncharacterized protein LOC122284558 n=1 Tax=Carya illinoinensis TaxID=32201 RepID=UPI001C71D62C|nr:uncharacterized protein LOC122284558 [Carya illinoinensis]